MELLHSSSVKYKICGIFIKIDNLNIYIDKSWRKFLTDLIQNLDIIVSIDENYYIKDSNVILNFEFPVNTVIKYNSDLMYVSNDWKRAKLFIKKEENVSVFLIQVFHTHAVRNHMIQVHSSLIEYKNSGIMFLGPSGIGKTTQAELWHQYLDALIINGDMVFMEDKGDEFIGWGTPWHGSSPYCENTSVPVKALVVLKQGQENRIRKLEGFEKVSEVSNNIIYPMWIEDGMDLCLETLDHLLTHVPVYELVNKADEDSVLMVKQVVFDEKN